MEEHATMMSKRFAGIFGCAALSVTVAMGALLWRPSTNTAVVNASTLTSAATAVISAAPMTMYDEPLSIEPDSKNTQKGYVSYEVTQYRSGKHLITAIRTGNTRDRTVLADTDGESWVELDVSTESDKGTFRFYMVDESTAELKVNGEVAARATADSSGAWTRLCIATDELERSSHALEVLVEIATDANLNAQLEVFGPFATKAVTGCGCAATAQNGLTMTFGGPCWAPIWLGGRVKFKNCTGGYCILPETGNTQNCSPQNDTWYDADGIIGPWHAGCQWFKIPGHCSVTIDCAAGTLECCCNLGGILYTACFECASMCKEMDKCAHPNDPCHNHGALNCSCP